MVKEGSKGNNLGSCYKSLVEYDVMEIMEEGKMVNDVAIEDNHQGANLGNLLHQKSHTSKSKKTLNIIISI